MCRSLPLVARAVLSSGATTLLAGVARPAQHAAIPLTILHVSLVRRTDSRVGLRSGMHVDLALPQDANRILWRSACCYASIKATHVDGSALSRLIRLHLLTHQAWVQALRHLWALRCPVFVRQVPPCDGAGLLELVERNPLLVPIFLVLFTPRLLGSVGADVAVGGSGCLLRHIVRSHVLRCLLQLSVAHSLFVCVHPVLLAAKVDLVLVDYELWQ